MPLKIITLEEVERLRAEKPHRCRFEDNPIVRKRDDGTHVVSTKFPCIDRLFEAETGIETRDGRYGPYKFLTDESEIARAYEWQESRQSLIFLKDALDCSVALAFNLVSLGEYTEIGQAEHDAKTSGSLEAVKFLAAKCAAALESLRLYRDCDLICAVPPSPDKAWDLPTEIVKRVAAPLLIDDISLMVKFSKKKQSIKDLALPDKWAALEAAELKVLYKVSGHKIVLIDDKYQSGTTIQFVASKLFEAGAAEVLGLYCVKTWRDTDNK